MQGLPRRDDSEGYHRDRANNRRPRAVNLEPWEFAQRKYKVTGNENDVGSDQGGVGQRDRADFVHMTTG